MILAHALRVAALAVFMQAHPTGILFIILVQGTPAMALPMPTMIECQALIIESQREDAQHGNKGATYRCDAQGPEDK